MNFHTNICFHLYQKENNKYNKYNAVQLASTAEPQLYLLYLLSYFYRCDAVTYCD